MITWSDLGLILAWSWRDLSSTFFLRRRANRPIIIDYIILRWTNKSKSQIWNRMDRLTTIVLSIKLAFPHHLWIAHLRIMFSFGLVHLINHRNGLWWVYINNSDPLAQYEMNRAHRNRIMTTAAFLEPKTSPIFPLSIKKNEAASWRGIHCSRVRAAICSIQKRHTYKQIPG